MYNGLLIAITLCSSTLTFTMNQARRIALAPHHINTFKSIIKKNKPFECAVPKIKTLAQQDPEWQQILSSSHCTGKLITMTSSSLDVRQEFIAAMLATPGAIKWGKKYIKDKPECKKNLDGLLIDTAQWSIEKLEWENQDLDVATAILQMSNNANALYEGDIVYDENPGATALTSAAAHNKTALVKLLLENGVNIEIESPADGRTAVMAAALYGYDDTLKLLIGHGANVNAKNCFGNTALLWASGYAHVQTVEILIAANADVNARNEDNETPLKLARTSRSSQDKDRYKLIEKMLIDAGAKE